MLRAQVLCAGLPTPHSTPPLYRMPQRPPAMRTNLVKSSRQVAAAVDRHRQMSGRGVSEIPPARPERPLEANASSLHGPKWCIKPRPLVAETSEHLQLLTARQRSIVFDAVTNSSHTTCRRNAKSQDHAPQSNRALATS